MTHLAYTIGHSTHELPTFIALLRQHGVDTLADIRSYPGSRHTPQFGKATLRDAIESAGLTYVHLVDLGGRRPKQCDASHNSYWTHPSFRNYADYAERDPAFQAALSELLALCQTHIVAYMCAEALWWKCHRRIVTDYLLARGLIIYHIATNGRTEKALINIAACQCGSALIYGCESIDEPRNKYDLFAPSNVN